MQPLSTDIKHFQLVEHMAVLRKEPGIWNQQFNSIPATNASSPKCPHFRGPDPICSMVALSVPQFLHAPNKADGAVLPPVCRLVTI